VNHDLAFIGAGNMAEAIARAVIHKQIHSPDRLIAFDPVEARRAVFASLGIHVASDNRSTADDAATVLLCVKPQMMIPALADLAGAVGPQHLVISIAAGISTGFIESRLGDVRVIRAMPNTPMLAGLGATGICRGRNASEDDLQTARRLFESAGVVVDVDEPLMDAVTAVSGSGPAYFFYLVEHMISSATALGLTVEQATTLVYQTAAGAARMLQTSAELPQELRRRVTSPGGTTQAAIEHLQQHLVGQRIEEAIAAAQRRGRELGR
jgi:pyrroline-5-carboxylate reductase